MTGRLQPGTCTGSYLTGRVKRVQTTPDGAASRLDLECPLCRRQFQTTLRRVAYMTLPRHRLPAPRP